MKYTKEQLKTAMYLFLDDFLPSFECKKIAVQGNWQCNRCDDCMFEQYLKRAKTGEQCRKVREVSIEGR